MEKGRFGQFGSKATLVESSAKGGKAKVELLNAEGRKVGTADFLYTLRKMVHWK